MDFKIRDHMKRDTHRSSYMYMYMCFRIKLYFKTACLKAYLLINTVVIRNYRKNQSKGSIRQLRIADEPAKTKTPLQFGFTSAPCPRFYVAIQLKKHLNQQISIILLKVF